MVRRLVMTLVAALLAAACSAPVAGATTPGDNGRIVYSAETSNGVQLFTVRPDGSNVRQITTVQGDAVHADWAPNGRKLVFEFAGETHAGIALINPDGSGLRDLTPTGIQGQPAFTADGRHIVFGANDGIAIMRTDGTGRRQLTQTPFPGVGFDDDPNVSPDGKLVTFVRVKTPRSNKHCSRCTSTAATSAS